VREEHGEELEARDELMVAAEARVQTGAPVKDAAIIQILEPLERHRGALKMFPKDCGATTMAGTGFWRPGNCAWKNVFVAA
jgi:hypothetical protein